MAEMTREEMLAAIAKLTETNAALATKLATKQTISCKVSEKGALSIYGLGRWPITIYKSQFDTLFADDTITKLRAFRKANDHLLKSKDD